MIRTQQVNKEQAQRVINEIQAGIANGLLRTAGDIEAAYIKKTTSMGDTTEQYLEEFITQDDEMIRMKSRIRRLVFRKEPVLISGPTGTGKELFAAALQRPGLPYICRNCAAMPETLVDSLLFGHKRGAFTNAVADHMGILEEANGGTVFLDEVGDMPQSIQPKLLRAIQEREIVPVGGGQRDMKQIHCRFIFATKKDIERLVEEGHFRDDLYARISTFRIITTPLSSRPRDIKLIRDSLVTLSQDSDPIPDFDSKTMAAIDKYNVRAIQRAMLNYQLFGVFE